MVQTTSFDNHVFLAGRPPMGEFIGLVQALSQCENPPNPEQIANSWRNAYRHILELEEKEADFADNPPIIECQENLQAQISTIRSGAMFQRAFAFTPTRIAMVELDRLVVFQKHINLRWAEKVTNRLGSSPSPETVFNVCLPLVQENPPLHVLRSGTNSFVFSSPSVDLRFIEPMLIEPEQITNSTLSGRPCKVLGLTIGFGTNLMSAISIEDWLVLNDGSHRAYALRSMGITHAPCVIQQASCRDELETITRHDLAYNPDRYLDVIRPPLLKDYFDPCLHTVIPIPRHHRQIKLSYNVETLDVPEV